MVVGVVSATSVATPVARSSATRPATAAWTASPMRAAALPVGAANATERWRPRSAATRWAAASSLATV